MRTITRTIVDDDIKDKLKSSIQEEAQVVVHCNFFAASPYDRFRIWPTTYLIDRQSGKRSKLVHAENVPYSPMWKLAQSVGVHQFTLVFEPLGKKCSTFDLLEIIPETGAFEVRDISRNRSDVYSVEL